MWFVSQEVYKKFNVNDNEVHTRNEISMQPGCKRKNITITDTQHEPLHCIIMNMHRQTWQWRHNTYLHGPWWCEDDWAWPWFQSHAEHAPSPAPSRFCSCELTWWHTATWNRLWWHTATWNRLWWRVTTESRHAKNTQLEWVTDQVRDRSNSL